MLLNSFFATEPDPVMRLYSLEHIIPLLLCIFLVVMIYRYRKFFRNWKYEKYFRFSLFILLILSEITIAVWRGMTGTYDITHTLPLHLCSFSAIVIEIVLLTKSQKIMDYVYYVSISGAFVAMVYPDLRFSFLQYRYWEFFVFHVLIVFSTFYMVFVHKLIPSKKSFFKGILVIHIISIPIIIFNSIVNGSYMMLVNTSVPLLVELFGEWPRYILGLEVLLAVLFAMNYLITYFFVYRNKQFINESV